MWKLNTTLRRSLLPMGIIISWLVIAFEGEIIGMVYAPIIGFLAYTFGSIKKEFGIPVADKISEKTALVASAVISTIFWVSFLYALLSELGLMA